MSKSFTYILDFKANTDGFNKGVGGAKGLLKTLGPIAAGAFAADKIMDAAKAVADYAVEISKTRGEVQALTGLTGQAANNMTGAVTALGKAYDQDVGESIRASNVLMRSFEQTSGQAFDLLNAGLAGAANANGDLLEQISEYSPHFAEAGLEANEMFAVIKAGNQMGVFGDKAADSIKEGSIRLREMTQSTKDALDGIGLSSDQIQKDISSGAKSMFDVMRDVSSQLDVLPAQSPAVGAALADIFGGPGEDAVNFIRNLKDVDTSMEGLMEGATEAQIAQQKYAEELKEFHSIGAQVFGGTGALMTKMKAAGMSMVNSIIKGVVDVINYFIDLYNESAVVRGAFEYMKFSITNIFKVIKLSFQNLLNVFKGLGKVIKAVFTGDFKSIKGIVEDTFNATKEDAINYGKETAENFSKAVQNTLTPKKKIALVTLGGDAEATGEADGHNYAKGLAAGMGGGSMAKPTMTILPDLKVKDTGSFEDEDLFGDMDFAPALTDSQQLATSMGVVANSMDDARRMAEGMGEAFDEAATKKELLQQQISTLINSGLDPESEAVSTLREQLTGLNEQQAAMDVLNEKAQAVAGAVSQSFSAMGNSVMEGLGLADTGMQGFLKSLGSTVIELISMMMAQSIANAIAGATSSAVATGPGAVFAQPAFIATAVGGILSAFAAIPEFAAGGVVSGRTTAVVGEYPNASTNPEVIAPLNKLQGMIGTRTEAVPQEPVVLETRIKGDDIYLSQKKVTNKYNRRG